MFKVGDLVLVITERKQDSRPIIGKIEEIASQLLVNDGKVNNGSIIYKIDGKFYGGGDILGVGDITDEYDGTRIAFITEDSVFMEDAEGRYRASTDDFYYCETCGELHVQWSSVTYLNDEEDCCCDECKSDDDEDLFKAGYLTALDEIVKSFDDDDNIIHETLKSFNCFIEDLLEEDYNSFYKERCHILAKKNEPKPQLTLEQIKEKLGFDFELVDSKYSDIMH